MDERHLQVAQRTAARFAELPDVEAVAVAGSQLSGMGSELSDIDVYVYSRAAIPVEARMAIGAEFSDDVVTVDYWGPGNEWHERETDIHVDVIFWTVEWIEDQIDRTLSRYQPQLGYTTSLWYTVRISDVLFDRHGWFARLQHKASLPYPEPLTRAIVAHNHPVLRRLPSSYLRQLEKASARNDLVSLNHRAAALLASYFDIVFAVNRQLHPGEKRLIAFAEQRCPHLPVHMAADIEALLQATVRSGEPVSDAANALLDHLDELLYQQGFLT